MIDQLVLLTTSGSSSIDRKMILYLVIYLGYGVFEQLMSQLGWQALRHFRWHGESESKIRLYSHINKLGISRLEDPEIANKILRAEKWVGNFESLFNYSRQSLFQLVKVISGAIILIPLIPFITVALSVYSIVTFLPHRIFARQEFDWFTDNSEDRRAQWNIYHNLKSPAFLKEIYINGAFKYLDNRFRKFSEYFNNGILRLTRNRTIIESILIVISNVIFGFSFFIILQKTLDGDITIGQTTFYLSSVTLYYYGVWHFVNSLNVLNEFTFKMTDLFELLDMPAENEKREIRLPRLKEAPGISINNLSFAYPKSKTNIFNHLSLDIKPGEKIAFVGANGAGKTTLVKLIAGLYPIDSGELFINDHNINDLNTDDLHKNIGLLFQDYNHYDYMTAEDNIYIGKSIKKMDHKAIKDAAKKSDAHEFIMKYPKKYDQVLGERYEDGIRPSTGQKQKIALARFFYRNAPLAIFDEPTSAIDAVSEYNIFNQIYDFFKDKTVIIVSHRFSTVRNADRIVHIKEGEIIEEGSHEELMKLDGEYAEAFRLQAEGYN